MDNLKNDQYYLKKIIKDIEFSISNVKNLSLTEFSENEVINSAICFKFVQLSENSKMISSATKQIYSNIPWKMIVGLRNRIVHDYGNVQFDILYETATKDLPVLLVELTKILEEGNLN